MLPPAGEEGPEDRLMCCAARDVVLSWTAAVAVEPLKQQQLQLVPLRGSSQGDMSNITQEYSHLA